MLNMNVVKVKSWQRTIVKSSIDARKLYLSTDTKHLYFLISAGEEKLPWVT